MKRTMVTYKDIKKDYPHLGFKHYKGWVYCRPRVVTMLERNGITGDVIFDYIQDDKAVRTVKCGI